MPLGVHSYGQVLWRFAGKGVKLQPHAFLQQFCDVTESGITGETWKSDSSVQTTQLMTVSNCSKAVFCSLFFLQ